MTPLVWLAVAIVAAVAAWVLGWPAWQAYRSRETRDLNTERYHAWRGHSVRGRRPATREGMTGEERRRIYGAAALGVVAIVALVAFFMAS